MLRPAALLLSLTTLVACDDQPLQITDTLGGDEAQALAEVLVALTVQPGQLDVVDGPGSGPPAAPTTIETTLELNTPCPLGGSLDVAAALGGTFDPEAGTGAVSLDLTETHQACRVVHVESGQEFLLDGAPDLSVAYDLSWGADSYEAAGDYQGAIDWSTDGRSGRCTVALAFQSSGTIDDGLASATLEGTVCGVTISHTVTG
jgi:hypothetical protein